MYIYSTTALLSESGLLGFFLFQHSFVLCYSSFSANYKRRTLTQPQQTRTHWLHILFFLVSSWSVWVNALLEFLTFWCDSCLLCVSFGVSIFMPSPFTPPILVPTSNYIVWMAQRFCIMVVRPTCFLLDFANILAAMVFFSFFGGMKRRHTNLKQ